MSQTPVETWTESILLELTCMQKNLECEPASRVSIFWSTPLEKHKQTVSSLSKSPPHSLHLIFCLQKIIDWFLNLLKSVLKSSPFSTPFPNHWVFTVFPCQNPPRSKPFQSPQRQPPSNTLSSLALCHAKAGTPSICTSATCKTLESFMPLINGATCSLAVYQIHSAACQLQVPHSWGLPPKKISNESCSVSVRRFFYCCMTHGMSGLWQCPFLKPQVVAVTAGCQIERLRHGGTGAWTSPPGHWVDPVVANLRGWLITWDSPDALSKGGFKRDFKGWNQPSKPTEPKATGSIKLKVQYEAIGNPPVLKLLEHFGSSSTMFKCILGRFQCKKLSNILPGHGQDLRMAIGARFCANRSNNFQHCPCKDTAWKSLETYLLSTVW